MTDKILIAAGTTEGHRLYDELLGCGFDVWATVATEYGKEIIENNGRVLSGRLDSEGMKELLRKGFTLVVDATHPYAEAVTKNLSSACRELGIEYIRLLRRSEYDESILGFDTLGDAVDFLAKKEGNILSTIGSKELKALTAIPGYAERVFARILPMASAVQASNDLGFFGRNLICMQGPVSKQMNEAMIKEFDCRFLLTKDTGKNGGYPEKISAAKDCGICAVVVKRPGDEEGESFEEVLSYIKNTKG